ncbi:MAG: Hsp20/alpha crystallin family protein [Terriglobales bacterium]
MTSVYCSNGWTPRTDVLESEAGYQLQLDLPGVKAEDLDIQVEDSTLTVRAQRKLNGKREEYHRVERPYGAFTRSFTLPEAVKADGIEAKLSDGVLNLTLPRREEAKPRHITVSVQ